MPYENMSGSITRPSADNYHALFFVGVCNRQRYVLSLIRWTNLLNQMYGYPLANIRILVGPYSDLTWATMVAGTDTTYNATRTDLDNALAAYASGSGDPHELTANDRLFIFTYNHGGNDSDGLGSYLCCDGFTTKYYATDFETRIAAINCHQIVHLAAQCCAGGFIDPFINAGGPTQRKAIMAGSRAEENTDEAIFDKLFASAFNGRMVQNALDDNIDLGITGEGEDVYLVPGYTASRIDWGPTGTISTREAFNWVYDHYVNQVFPYYTVPDMPLYSQKPWTESGQPVHIRLGEPDLVMQDCSTDTGVEPSTCTSPWHSPDIRPDNSDAFPGLGPYEYVPAHHNRFYVRTANRGTAPTDDVWRAMEVRGLGFTGGPVGPPRIDRAVETSGADLASARLRPGRAQTQYERILIGDDFGHGCVSAAAFTNIDAMSHSLWSITEDNDQVQCNLDPAAVSGTVPVDSSDTNSNSGKIIRSMPITAMRAGTFGIRIGQLEKKIPAKIQVKKSKLVLRKGQREEFLLEIQVLPKTPDGLEDKIPVEIMQGKKRVGGVTFLIKTATSFAKILAHDRKGTPVPKMTVLLRYPGDPRVLSAMTNDKGIASFGPLNPGFYFVEIKGEKDAPLRVYIAPSKENSFKFEMSGR